METNETLPVTDENNVEEEEIDLAPTVEIIARIPKKERRYLIPTLQKIQDVYRYLPGPAVNLLMKELRITRAEIYGVISFYPQLRITEPGKYIIKLCYGAACFVKGAEIIAAYGSPTVSMANRNGEALVFGSTTFLIQNGVAVQVNTR